MVYKKMKFFACFLVCILFLLSFTQISATLIWEDDFDDGDLEGWDLTTYYTTSFATVPVVKGEVLIENSNNKLFLPNIYNGTHGMLNSAQRTSSLVYGHWSFDIDTTSGCHGAFMFVHHDPTPETDFEDEGWYLEKPNGIEGYGIQISTISDYQLMLARMDANFTNAGENASSIDDLLLDSVTFAELGLSRYGIFHLDVTRAPGGNMTVYLNTTKVLSALDDTYTISDSIRIDNFNHEPYYDNIIVDDDYSFIPGLPLTTTTTSSNGENPTTTTTESSSPGFEVELVLLSLFLIFVFSRKRRL